MSEPNRCHACYHGFSGWWCDNCDTWPCRCVPQEGDDASQEEAVPEEAVSVAEGGTGGVAPDAVDAAGVHGVPVRQAQDADVASEQEAARVAGIDHDPVSCIVAELQRAGAGAAIVAHGGSLDAEVRGMLADGYVLGETVYLHGKRIRYLVKPEVSGE